MMLYIMTTPYRPWINYACSMCKTWNFNMQTNSCYGDDTLPVHEEVQLQDKAPEPTDARVKQNERISSSFANKTKTNLGFLHVVVVLFLLAIAIVAAITLSVYALVSYNQGMDSMMKEIQELKMQLNKTKEASEMKIAKLKRDLTRIDGLMVQKSVDTATTTQLNSLHTYHHEVPHLTEHCLSSYDTIIIQYI